jgi:cell pole-organizing protein PopZ
MSCLRVFFLFALLMIGLPVLAHEPMAHDCAAPIRPVDDSNDQHWQAFLQQIDEFQACVNNAVQRHQAAAKDHQQQAQAVVQLWNTFVQTSLNAPEDFPWPPE